MYFIVIICLISRMRSSLYKCVPKWVKTNTVLYSDPGCWRRLFFNSGQDLAPQENCSNTILSKHLQAQYEDNQWQLMSKGKPAFSHAPMHSKLRKMQSMYFIGQPLEG